MRLRWILAALATFVIAGGFAGCGVRKSDVEKGIETQTLRRGIGPELGHLDPHIATEIGHYNVLSALLEGLVAEDPVDLHPVPGVADSWDVSADGLEYTFHLRPEARWSNGDPVTAEDFVASWRRVLTPALGAENSEHLYIIRGAEAFHRGEADFSQVGLRIQDSNTLVVSLARPEPSFLQRLNHVAFLPVHTRSIAKLGRLDDRNTVWSTPEHFIGNGPFRLEAWHQGQEIVAARSETYWDRQAVRLQRIHFVFTSDRDAEERAYRAGQLHLTEALPVAKVEAWKRQAPAELRIDPYLGTEFYRLNVNLPFFRDPRVRLALNLAIDRPVLVEKILRGGQQPAHTFVPPGLSGYTLPPTLAYEPERARALLSEAGYPAGAGAPILEILYNTSESHRALAEAIQSMWKKELGLAVKLVNQERIATLAARRTGDFQVLRSVWIADHMDPLGFLDLWRTGAANNFTSWSDPRYDAALAEAAAAASAEKRHTAAQAAEQILLEAPPFVLLYHYTHVFLLHPSVKGWHPTLLDHHPYKAVYLEP